MKEENTIQNTRLYKKNIKIHKNLWKVYTLTLIISLMIIAIKGIS